jgi:hypothetical protein
MAESFDDDPLKDNVIRWVFEAGEEALRTAVCGLPIALPASFSFSAHGQKFEAALRVRDAKHCVLTLIATLAPLPYTQEAPEARARILAALEALGGTLTTKSTLQPGGRPLLRWDVLMPTPCDLGQLTAVVVICVLGALPILKPQPTRSAA